MAITTRWSARTADAVLERLPVVAERWDYQWGVLLKGIEAVWDATGERRYLDYIRRNVDRFVGPDGAIATYAAADANLDHILPGRLLVTLHRETGEERYRRAAEALRAQLRAQPRTASGGFWHKGIYPEQMWLDGLYMAGPFAVEYAAAYGEPELFAEVVQQLTLIFERARDPRSGLLAHGWDESRRQRWADPRTGRSRAFWARGIGWYAMALVDVRELLRETTQRDTVDSILRQTMAAIARVQDEGGTWWQVLDEAGRPGNYRESSASCMFAYALAKGARGGYLPPEDRAVARRAYAGILEQFVRAAPDGSVELTSCCRGAGLSLTPDRDGSFDYYVSQPIVTNDPKGLGAFLLASVEIERAG